MTEKKLTKGQKLHEKSLDQLEFSFDLLLLKLREDNSNRRFLKKQKEAVAGLKYYIGKVNSTFEPEESVYAW